MFIILLSITESLLKKEDTTSGLKLVASFFNWYRLITYNFCHLVFLFPVFPSPLPST